MKELRERSIIGTSHYLIGEANADTEEGASDDEHGDVLRRPVKRSADEEGEPSGEHGPLAAHDPCDGGGEEGGDERREVEGGGERLEQLVVVLAVLVALAGRLLLPVHLREKLQEKGVHGRHPA